jgi:quinol monooxygenase YgiN
MTTSNPDEARMFVFVRLHAAPSRADAIRAALNKVVTASRVEAGCVRIDAFQSMRDPRLFFIHSVWKDAEAFDLHATLPHTLEFIDTVDAFVDEPRQVARTRQIM